MPLEREVNPNRADLIYGVPVRLGLVVLFLSFIPVILYVGIFLGFLWIAV